MLSENNSLKYLKQIGNVLVNPSVAFLFLLPFDKLRFPTANVETMTGIIDHAANSKTMFNKDFTTHDNQKWQYDYQKR